MWVTTSSSGRRTHEKIQLVEEERVPPVPHLHDSNANEEEEEDMNIPNNFPWKNQNQGPSQISQGPFSGWVTDLSSSSTTLTPLKEDPKRRRRRRWRSRRLSLSLIPFTTNAIRSRRRRNSALEVLLLSSLFLILISSGCEGGPSPIKLSAPSRGVWSHFVETNNPTRGLTPTPLSSNSSSNLQGPITLALASTLAKPRTTRKTEYTDFDEDSLILNDPATSRLWISGPCTCWNTTSDFLGLEVECKCSGPNFTGVHGSDINLPANIHRLSIEQAKDFTTLRNEDIRPYANTLNELVLSELPQFKEIKPTAFHGMRNLNTIYIHETHALREIHEDAFKVFLPKLKIIRITYTGLEIGPNLSQLHVQAGEALHMVELENGKISKLMPGSFNNLKTEHLLLSYNNLEEIGPWAFNGSTIAKLGLNGNRALTTLHPESFLGIQFLRVLDLSETSITYLPTQGLGGLEVLRLEHTWTLSVIPSIFNFQSLKVASLTWPYHCCAFENPERHDPMAFQAYQDYVKSTVQEHCDKAFTSTEPSSVGSSTSTHHPNTEVGAVTPSHSTIRRKKRRRRRGAVGQDKDPNDQFDPYAMDPERSFGTMMDTKDEINPWDTGVFGHESESEFDEEVGIFHSEVDPSPTVITLCGNVTLKKHPKVQCSPVPDAFNPCEDIMGSLWLRGAVWVVVALALMGNTAVLVVLLLAPGRMSVQRFLMANLSWADLCMGIYLLMVATQDLVSLGSYFNYAIDWQLGLGCQIAGFLTVFASELSVFTLMVITGERWYALTRAIHLTKRLTILGAAQLMGVGWLLSILLAVLPIIGVSSYSKTSICLPMDINSSGSVVYLSFLLVFNGFAFVLVASAYWHMYRAVAGHGGASSAAGASSADTAIAKKMALLVFTDFACWAPVAFFGLTAVGGYPLIGVTDSKILLVFFYPLNSTLNPYLYAIMTKQYRRDLLLLLSRHGICTKRAARYKTGGVSTNNTMQTMQTVLRLGSLTETKLLNPHRDSNGTLRRDSSYDSSSDRRTSMASNVSEVPVPAGTHLGPRKTSLTFHLPNTGNGSVPTHTNGKGSSKAPCEVSPSSLFDHPLLPTSRKSIMKNKDDPLKDHTHHHSPLNKDPRRESDDSSYQTEGEDLFEENGVTGRHLAETSFISVPPSSQQPHPQVHKNPSSSSSNNNKIRSVSEVSEYTIAEEEEDEVNEETPFCNNHPHPPPPKVPAS